MNTYGVDLMGRRRRRRHTAEFKAAVIEEGLRPGVSIAAVALAHSLNANMLRKWVIDAKHQVMAPPPAAAAEPEPPSMPATDLHPIGVARADSGWLDSHRAAAGRHHRQARLAGVRRQGPARLG